MCTSVPQMDAFNTRTSTTSPSTSGTGTSSSHRPGSRLAFTTAFINFCTRKTRRIRNAGKQESWRMAGLVNNNTALGATALEFNTDGSENTAVGTGAGQNVTVGFNNTYIGDFVGTLEADESNTIRIGDLSNGNGAGFLECFIAGIFNNFQPVGGTVVEVTLDLADDHLGWMLARTTSLV